MVDKVLHSQMPFTTGGQTINDRLTAAYHSLAGSQLGKTVCKATTEEPIAPKKKHLDYLLHCTHEPNVSIPQLANFIVERTTNTNWSVVYKALITLHNLMCYGNERFCQYLASSNANLSLGNFLDKTSMQGYDMSSHVRRYAKYISEKVYTYRMVAYDFCKVKRGREDGFLRVMATDKLLKALPLLQGQIDALLEFQIVQSDLANQVINCSFLLMFRDLIRLFACYNDGIINLLEKYFEMNKKQCAEGLELYKKFVERMDKVGEFLKIAESAGVDKGEIPDLVKAPSSLLESLESHLVSLGGVPEPSSKTSGNGRVTSPLSAGQFQPFANFGNNTEQQSHDPFDTSDARRRIFQQGGDENRENIFHEQKQHQTADRKQSDFDLFSPNTTGRNRINFNDNQKTNAIDDLLSLDAPTTAAPPSSTNPFASDFGGGGGAYHQQQQQPPSGQLQPPFASPWSVSPTPGVVSSGRLSISSVSTPNVAIFLSRNSISSPISNGGGSGAGFLPFANENSFAKAFGSPPKIYNTGGYGSVGGGNVYPEYSAEFQGNVGYSQYAASSRGISPAPDEESTAGHNPFLTDSYGAGAHEHGMVDESAFPQPSAEWHAGYDQEPMPKDDQNAHAAAAFNPFAPVQSHPAVQSLDLGGGQLRPGKSPAVSALSSAIPSPAASGVASPMRGFSQPMGIPQQLGGGSGGAFEHANFGAGGMQQQQQQYPRFMTPPPQPRAASSYGGPSVFETEMSSSDHQAWNRGPPRPPSAPPTELQGLDPLGDLLTPQPTSGAPTSGAPAPGVLAPSQQQQQQMRKPTGKIIKGDLDSSLASLAENLSIGKGGQENLKKPVQWSASGKPGQQQQQQQQQPGWNPGAQQQGFPGGMVGYPQQQQQQPMWGQQQMGAPGGMMMGAPMQAAYGQPRPGFGAPPPQAMMYGSGQAPMGGGYPMGGQMPNYGGQPQQQMPQQAGGHPPAGYDPFGAL